MVLPGEAQLEKGKSAWVVDANYAPTDRWTIGASYQWDPKFRREDLASVRARYLLPDDGVVNITYRRRRDLLRRSRGLSRQASLGIHPAHRHPRS